MLKRLTLAAALLVVATVPTRAADPGDELLAQARREGKVVVYMSMTAEQVNTVNQRFLDTYHLPIEFLRLSGEELPLRILTEQRGGRFAVDTILDPGLEVKELAREGMLARYVPPEARDVLSGSTDPDGYWVTAFIKTEVILYNRDRLRAAGIKPPAAWEDFARPEWRGKFGIAGDDVELYAALRAFYGKDRTEQLLRALAANQPHLLASHSLGLTLLNAGEVQGVVAAYGADALTLIRKGGLTAEIVNPVPTPLQLNAMAIMKTAPHPNAARLYERWFLSKETQQWLARSYLLVSARKDMKNDTTLIDPRARYTSAEWPGGVEFSEGLRAFRALFNIPG
jgi:iron(III) transport system substrate-binding protein